MDKKLNIISKGIAGRISLWEQYPNKCIVSIKGIHGNLSPTLMASINIQTDHRILMATDKKNIYVGFSHKNESLQGFNIQGVFNSIGIVWRFNARRFVANGIKEGIYEFAVKPTMVSLKE